MLLDWNDDVWGHIIAMMVDRVGVAVKRTFFEGLL